MNRLLVLLASLCVLTGAAFSPAVHADPPDVTVRGTVIGYDPQSDLLNVNTRLGSRLFLVTASSLILLNDHNATVNDITPGDRVRVTYDYNTSEAVIVDLTREVRRTGKVTSVSTNGFNFRLPGGGNLTLTTNVNTRITVGGLLVENRAILVGRQATLLYEPVTFLALGLSAQAQTVSGAITAIDATARTLSVARNATRAFTVDTNATIRRDGVTATLADLVVGDRITLAFVRHGTTRRALVLQARSQVAAP